MIDVQLNDGRHSCATVEEVCDLVCDSSLSWSEERIVGHQVTPAGPLSPPSSSSSASPSSNMSGCEDGGDELVFVQRGCRERDGRSVCFVFFSFGTAALHMSGSLSPSHPTGAGLVALALNT